MSYISTYDFWVYIIVFVSNQSDNPSPGPAAVCVSRHLFIYTYCVLTGPSQKYSSKLTSWIEWNHPPKNKAPKVTLKSGQKWRFCKWKYTNKIGSQFCHCEDCKNGRRNEIQHEEKKSGHGMKWIKCSLLLELCVVQLRLISVSIYLYKFQFGCRVKVKRSRSRPSPIVFHYLGIPYLWLYLMDTWRRQFVRPWRQMHHVHQCIC